MNNQGKQYPHTERDATIVQMIDNGVDIRCIAEMFSLSRERVRQVIIAQGRKSNAQVHRKKETKLRRSRNLKKCKCGKTLGENLRRKYEAVQCKECYLQSIRHLTTNSKLTIDQVLQIDSRLNRGDSQSDIAAEFGITPGAVGHIQTGRCWSKVTGRKNIRNRTKQVTT